MKKILQSIYLCLLTISMIAFIGCTEEDWAGTENVVEGKPITVSMKLGSSKVGNIEVSTRANDDFSDLNNLMIFIYNSNGVCESVVSTIDRTLTIETSGSISGGRTHTVTFNTTSGRKKLLAVANGEDNGFWNDLNTETLKTMTFTALKDYVISLGQSVIGEEKIQPFQIIASSQMLISGWNEDLIFGVDGAVTNYGSDGDINNQVAVKMSRLMAHITFKIDEKLVGAKGTFVPTSYRVYNVPKASVLTNKDKNISNLQEGNFINFNQEVIKGADEGMYTFSFYMPENICKVADGVSVTDYNERDAWTGASGSTPEAKTWSKAPKRSTFVVISGTYTETGEHNYTGNVEYTIHLGDFSAEGSMDNFSVERNCSYTYNMYVKGVDNIVVEAKKESGDYQNGAEGDIYDSSSSKYNYLLDAHYEQVLLEYDLTSIANSLGQGLSGEELDNAIADKLILVIQSEAMDYSADESDYSVSNKRGRLKPYKIYADAIRDGKESAAEAKERVLGGAGTGVYPTKGFDYKWVEFWPQSSATELAKYPGVSSWSRDDVSDMRNQYYYGETVTSESEKLMDVYDVIVAMGKVIKKIYNRESIETGDRNEDGIIVSHDALSYKARFTAFVNEYFYLRHPLTGEKVEMWSVFTNKIPREMIIAMSTDTSEDGNSTYSYIHSNISQLSMQTFYNSRVKSLNGFGIESYNETPINYKFGKTGTSGTLSDGHQNQLDLIKGNSYYNPSWETYINYKSNGWTTSIGEDRASHKLKDAAYIIQKAYSACMSRNRDLNGNGTIDNNEVRWYLASVNEYIRMGIGTNAVSSAAQLYMGSKSAMEKNSYPSSYISQGSLYYTSSGDNERVYWAVEKGSYGGQGSYGALPIRCIRILPGTDSGEHDISTVEGVKTDATYELYSGGHGRLSVLKFKGRLVESLYRERVATTLNVHNEDQPANSFYDGIIVASKNIGATSKSAGTSYKLGDIIGYNGRLSWSGGSYSNNGTKTDPCRLHYSEGNYGIGQWRVPNLVELSAMKAAGLLDSGQEIACCTQFSNQKVRFGFSYSSLIYCPGAEEYQIGSGFKIRCVRDVDNGYFGN